MFFTHVSHFWVGELLKEEKIEIFMRRSINALLPHTYGYQSMKTNHEHILSRAAQNQHLWKFFAELNLETDSFIVAVNEFKKLTRKIAAVDGDTAAKVEYVCHLIRERDATTTLRFVASLPISESTGESVHINEDDLELMLHGLWQGDLVWFSNYEPESSITIAECLRYPAHKSLITKMIMSTGLMAIRSNDMADIACALCGE
jgi:hypothetical protein